VAPGHAATVAVVGGRDGRQGHARAYLELTRAARRELLLATPYFLPDPAFRRELVAASRRGVRVVVVIPRRCDIGLFKHAARRLYVDLLSAGIEIRERLDRMVHAKVAVVDGALAAIGSVNLNRRSFYGNSETLVLGAEPRLAAAIRSLVLEESAASCEVMSPQRWRAHPERDRLAELAVLPLALVF
jgi:cardiolipin synthase